MAINKDGERWKVDVQPGGRGERRIRKWFDTKTEALRFERHVQAAKQSGKPWDAGAERDKRRLKDLVGLWFERHGRSLKDGEGRRVKLEAIADRVGNPVALSFNAEAFTGYRAERLKEVGENTTNRELAYLKAMFNELRRCGVWKGANPLELVRRIKIDEQELTFLTRVQIDALLAELGESDARKIAQVCLATGARWSEAESLRGEQVTPYRVTFSGTKSGKVRTIPISPELFGLIEGKHGRVFVDSYSQFRTAIKRTGIALPDGQLTHVLRHTFASYFMQNGGNILTLQKVLGHQSLQMTMRYAHMAPDHLDEVLRLNPIEEFRQKE